MDEWEWLIRTIEEGNQIKSMRVDPKTMKMEIELRDPVTLVQPNAYGKITGIQKPQGDK